MQLRFRTSAIEIKTPEEIELMREAGRLAADTLSKVDALIRPGVTTDDINEFVHQDTLAKGAIPAPLNYKGFPKSVCTSINEVVCHGIPSNRKLRDGDIINVDVTHKYEGFHGDTSVTFYVGAPSAEAVLVTEVARRSLELGIAEVRPGARIGDIGAAIQAFAHSHGCSVVRDFVGHGIGRTFHAEPQVSHAGRRGTGPRLRPGMTFTIDGSLSAQFEHTILVTEDGHEILTARTGPLSNSDRFPDYFDKH